MARVRIAANEVDANFRVEKAIAELLRHGETAEISMQSVGTIEMLENVDHGETMTPSHKLSRLDQILAIIEEDPEIHSAEYEVLGDAVQFRRKPR